MAASTIRLALEPETLLFAPVAVFLPRPCRTPDSSAANRRPRQVRMGAGIRVRRSPAMSSDERMRRRPLELVR